jgi:DNA-binding response OmpR family regulator
MRLLIVEDEPVLVDDLYSYFRQQGFECEIATCFSHGEEKILNSHFDMVVLDISLPGGSGLKLLQVLKELSHKTGILVVSAKDSLEDKLHGLNLGADDYITKPFYLEELNARINALWRRKFLNGSMIIEFDGFKIDPNAKSVVFDSKELVLTKKEFELLLFLVLNKNRVVSKQSVAEHLWGDHYDLEDNYDAVYMHTMNLRKKIKKACRFDYIKTVYGMGYKFVCA